MALDSAQKRRSIMSMGLPWRRESIPTPDGSISEEDRHQFFHLYAIAFQAPLANFGIVLSSATKDVIQTFTGIVDVLKSTFKIR